jgi:hypothetical protein
MAMAMELRVVKERQLAMVVLLLIMRTTKMMLIWLAWGYVYLKIYQFC